MGSFFLHKKSTYNINTLHVISQGTYITLKFQSIYTSGIYPEIPKDQKKDKNL